MGDIAEVDWWSLHSWRYRLGVALSIDIPYLSESCICCSAFNGSSCWFSSILLFVCFTFFSFFFSFVYWEMVFFGLLLLCSDLAYSDPGPIWRLQKPKWQPGTADNLIFVNGKSMLTAWGFLMWLKNDLALSRGNRCSLADTTTRGSKSTPLSQTKIPTTSFRRW